MRRGFTLIELLVVIAIIAILAAILFPVFAKAREKARSASCESNLKQISLAVLMYAQDYDEKFPRDWFVQCVTGPRPERARGPVALVGVAADTGRVGRCQHPGAVTAGRSPCGTGCGRGRRTPGP